MYLRVRDATDTKRFTPTQISDVLSLSRPQPFLDKRNDLHLLYEDGARSFNCSVINPDGEILVRQTHRYTDSAPRLKEDDTGEIAVVGGMRQVAANDLPRIKPVDRPANDQPAPNN